MTIGDARPTRRSLVVSAAASLSVVTLFGSSGSAAGQEIANGWEDALKALMRGGKLGEGKITFDLPEIAENGNTVPFMVAVESPMTDSDHVKSLHVISTSNPQPLISSFQFAPASGRAAVSGRLRLAKTQDVISLAEMSDGRFLMSKRLVKVTIGGCGG